MRLRSTLPRRARGPAAALAALAALTTLATPGREAAAQPADSLAAPRTDPFCWRGRPLPRCAAFALFELGYHARVAGTSVRTAEGGRVRFASNQLVWAVGAMRNTDSATALGGAVVLGQLFNSASMVGAQLRWRRWTGPRTSAELGAGPARMPVPLPPSPGALGTSYGYGWGLAADARLNFADRVAGGARVLAVPHHGRVDGALLAGGSVGSGLAVAGTVGIAATIAAVIVALARWN